MRRLLVAGNWKMHGNMHMTSDLITGVCEKIKSHNSVSDTKPAYDVLFCPPAPYLSKAVDVANSQSMNVYVGAQNVSQHKQGAYTGEISLPMLAELGCQYVLLGHSERRDYYAESDDLVAEKFAACIASDSPVVPILCVGETLAEREAGDTEKVVAKQINAVLSLVGINGFAKKNGDSSRLAVIAYEPVWAIGTGETASPEQAQAVHKFIRELLVKSDARVAEKIQLLYGGSVKPGNAEELFAQDDIDGGLIGGAALDIDSFVGICEAAQKLTSN